MGFKVDKGTTTGLHHYGKQDVKKTKATTTPSMPIQIASTPIQEESFLGFVGLTTFGENNKYNLGLKQDVAAAVDMTKYVTDGNSARVAELITPQAVASVSKPQTELVLPSLDTASNQATETRVASVVDNFDKYEQRLFTA